MRICTLRSLYPRSIWGLLLSLLLVLTSPSAVQAASATEATAPDCTQTELGSQPVAVQLTRTEGLVQATLHAPPGALPAAGCRVPLEFHIPEDARPPQAVWRDVEGRAVQPDGIPDPAHPDPLPLRLWIQPDGTLQYAVREAGLPAAHAALDLAVAWGTTAAANDLAVMDILGTALGLELDVFKPVPEWEPKPWELLGARLDDRGRVSHLDWHDTHPDEYWEDSHRVFMAPAAMRPKVGLHPPGVRVMWQLPSELGQLSQLRTLRLGGPLLTGVIPPELGQLANLEQLTLAGSRLSGAVPPELGQLTKLGKLELHHNLLTALPPELGQLTQLSVLSLVGNRLTALPPELGQLIRLRTLGLAGNQLTALPPELVKLNNLEDLGLAGNQLTTLPSGWGRLPKLEALDVQDNRLTSLPPLAGFNQLYYLDLSGNLLTTLPEGLPRSLLRLDMSDNRLQELNVVGSLILLNPHDEPSLPFTLSPQAGSLHQNLHKFVKAFTKELRAFKALSSLEYLDLSGNRLTSLPPEFGRLGLRHLDLSGNRLTSLPSEFGQLRLGLRHLDLSGNRLASLPPEITRFGSATSPNFTVDMNLELDLSGNQLTELPPELGQLSNLYSLNLSGNQLETVPPVIVELSTLETLDLSDNLLTSLPPEIGQLSELYSLNLSGNRLTSVPPELGQLRQLDSLDLSGNRLTALPPELKRSSRLRHLNLSGNQSTTLPPELGLLSQLDSLDLSGNQLADWHPDLGHLKNLTHLDLGDNQLTALPPDLVQLEHLVHLDLSHNQFTEIPAVLSQLPPLRFLDLRGNPLTSCALPLPWRIDRSIYPPAHQYNFDQSLMSLTTSTEHPDLPFLELCVE